MSEARNNALPDRPESRSIKELVAHSYEHGFISDIEADSIPPGLDENIIRFISAKKREPEFMLEWRLKAYRAWRGMQEPDWAHVHYPPIDFDSIVYYSAPKSLADGPKSLDEVDPELLRTYEKLGIPLHEQQMLPVSPSTRCSTVYPSPPRSRKSWRKPA